jgi:hypothetical protein
VRALNKKAGQFGIFIDEVFRGRQSAPAFGRPLRAEGNIAFVASARMAAEFARTFGGLDLSGKSVLDVGAWNGGSAASKIDVKTFATPVHSDPDIEAVVAGLERDPDRKCA